MNVAALHCTVFRSVRPFSQSLHKLRMVRLPPLSSILGSSTEMMTKHAGTKNVSNSPVMDGLLTLKQLGFFLTQKNPYPSRSIDNRNMRWRLTVGFPIDEPLDIWLRLPASIAPKGVVLSFGLVHIDWPWVSNKLRCSCKDIYIDGTFHIY